MYSKIIHSEKNLKITPKNCNCQPNAETHFDKTTNKNQALDKF